MKKVLIYFKHNTINQWCVITDYINELYTTHASYINGHIIFIYQKKCLIQTHTCERYCRCSMKIY